MKTACIFFLIWDGFCFLTCPSSPVSITSKLSGGAVRPENLLLMHVRGHGIVGSELSSFRELKCHLSVSLHRCFVCFVLLRKERWASISSIIFVRFLACVFCEKFPLRCASLFLCVQRAVCLWILLRRPAYGRFWQTGHYVPLRRRLCLLSAGGPLSSLDPWACSSPCGSSDVFSPPFPTIIFFRDPKCALMRPVDAAWYLTGDLFVS